MKKIVIILVVLSILSSCGLEYTESGTTQNTKAADSAATTAAVSIPVPIVQHFPERRTIAEWSKTFDVPAITCYIYLFSFGNIIGYYVTNGKPASTESYLTPSYVEIKESGPIVINKELPDIDGTYGSNQPGIRFFTASGIAVEWAGSGASYLFSTQKLPINVLELGN